MAKLARIRPESARLQPVEERRSMPRRKVSLPITLRVPSIEAALVGHAVNVSCTGMFIATYHPPPVGTRIQLALLLGEGQLLLSASAEVVRHQNDTVPPGVGVRFIDVAYEAQELIDMLVSDED